ncbi:hypothetical protein [Prosthecobacter sp.]|uniref:hypothetical protein n=1 Tax=Prosthecobacter sp. TaxID=1965333 RepID=UPI001DFCEB96|nr:hypothetical protein [Prosthecobacter sp.]MCB1278901.1 hypothetical protein [Prosthecobacter sp.]
MNARHFVAIPMVAVLIGASMVCVVHAQTSADRAVVKGTFLGDGKDGKIQYLVVQTREPFSDQAAIRLVFTEKDPSSSEKPDFDAAFKKLGSALILSVFRNGDIFGCEVAHTEHPKSPFSALGEIKMKDFKVTDTHVSGQVTTGGELDAFGQKWNVDLTFSAPLPKGAFAAAEEPASEPKKVAKEKSMPAEPAVAAEKLPVGKLPLPSGALDVEYKSVVEQIAFRSDAPVSTVAGEFAAKLKEQGWKDGLGSLIGKNNAILKRELNGADLTIMVQPAGTGCTVKVFAQGLDWSNPPAATAAKSAAGSDAESIEAEANRLINDALKQIPKGF